MKSDRTDLCQPSRLSDPAGLIRGNSPEHFEPETKPEQEVELWVPADRVRAILATYTGSYEHHPASVSRRVSSIKAGDQKYVSLTVVDKLFCALDLTDWLHYRAEDGGLADIYEDGKQYGKPPKSVPRYTPKERVKARQASAERHEINRNRLVPLLCPSCGVERMVGRRYAQMAQGRLCRACDLEIKRQNQLRKAA